MTSARAGVRSERPCCLIGEADQGPAVGPRQAGRADEAPMLIGIFPVLFMFGWWRNVQAT